MTSAVVSVVICARNAAETIERAVRSAVPQGGPVIVVDDWSDDATADVARRAGGPLISVVRPDVCRTLGFARSAGVAAVSTPWLQWLDADDELLPDRTTRLLSRAVAEGWDAAWDAAELWDGETGAFVRDLPMPAFMSRRGSAVRLFERNYTPGPAWPLVRTEFAREVDYDHSLSSADDLDFMLRGLQTGGRFGFVQDCGYRQFAYRSSLSRDLSHQRARVADVLRRHKYADVRSRYLTAGFSARVASWGLVSMALFREEWDRALAFLEEASAGGDPDEVLESDGPCPLPERWRRAFYRGTILLLLSGHDGDAADELHRAERTEPTAEGANNLGVALSRLGRRAQAGEWFTAAEERSPGYHDAWVNEAAETPRRITTHPLRHDPSRREYSISLSEQPIRSGARLSALPASL